MKQALMILFFYRITKVKLLILKNKLRNRIPVGHDLFRHFGKTNRGEEKWVSIDTSNQEIEIQLD